jgi:tripartite motif-containing protein 71
VWATRGGDQPRVAQPLDVAVAPDGKVWVADTPGRFHIFDSDGTYLETWGTRGSGPGQFRFTGSVGTGTFFTFAPDGSLYVADIFNHRIQRFGPDREYLGEWQSAFGAPDLWPAGIAFEPDGTLMVAGAPFANDIQWFTPDGTFIERWDASGTTDGPLGGPSDVARDPQGRLIVVEGDPARVRVFDQDRNQIAALDLSGQQPPAWSVPGDVEVDAAGNIYVSDGLNGLVRVFGPDLMFAYQWGQNGEGQAVMTHPDWLGLGPSGEIYVSDGVGLLRRFDLPTDDRDKPSASPAP